MKPVSEQINNKKGGLKSVLARFCPVIKILRTVPCPLKQLSKITKKQSNVPFLLFLLLLALGAMPRPLSADSLWGNINPIQTGVLHNGEVSATNMTKTFNVGIGGLESGAAVAVRFTASTSTVLTGIKFYVSDCSANATVDFMLYLTSGTAGIGAPDFDMAQNDNLEPSKAIAWGKTLNQGVNNAGMWIPINFSSGTAYIEKGEVYWLILSSAVVAQGGGTGECWPQAPQAAAGFQPPLYWGNFMTDGSISDNAVYDAQMRTYYSLDRGGSWAGTDLTPNWAILAAKT
ncbi:MAG: hypothetical protein Q8P40_12915, partial [Nitrospirota bacterium]|nr:hypothetical protein [Nitrospirota bacterium]